jgi:O-antigen ligase
MNKNNQKIENISLNVILFVFFLISLVPFDSLVHIRIRGFTLHYLIVGTSVGIISVLTWLKQGKKFTFFDKWLIVLFLGVSVSIVTSIDRIWTMRTLISFFLRGFGVAFIASRIIRTSGDRKKTISVIIFVSTIVSLIGIMEFIFHRNPLFHELFSKYSRYYTILSAYGISSTFGHYLPLGVYLVLLFPISIYIWQENKSIFSVIPFISTVLAILFTLSRSAWLSGILSLVVYFLLKKDFKMMKKVSLVLLCLIIIILPVFFFSYVKQTFLTKFSPQTLKWEILSSHRTASYLTTWNIFKKYPVFGVGLGNYPKVHKIYKAEKASLEFETPDNMYLRLICETGIVGILTFLGFIIFVIRRIFSNIQFYKNTMEGNLFFAFFCGIIGFLLNLMTGDFLYWLTLQFTFFLIVGISAGASDNSTRGPGD